jgi:hypothetical protein
MSVSREPSGTSRIPRGHGTVKYPLLLRPREHVRQPRTIEHPSVNFAGSLWLHVLNDVDVEVRVPPRFFDLARLQPEVATAPAPAPARFRNPRLL